MLWENKIALNIVLAVKGSVCCTFIPNNTAPDETITKALQELTSLANKMAKKNAGINVTFTDWLKGWFKKWKGMVASFLTSLVTVTGVLTAIGCCIIP